MGLFKKKSAQVVRRGSSTEQRTVREVGGEQVVVRRFTEADAPKQQPAKRSRKQKQEQSRRPAEKRSRRPRHLEVAPPPDDAVNVLVCLLEGRDD